jgi:hypothetical protein
MGGIISGYVRMCLTQTACSSWRELGLMHIYVGKATNIIYHFIKVELKYILSIVEGFSNST